ncbi:molybdopterin cofactor-binding domain-containing protein [Bradyrhizobium sp. Arg816]|uniref:xanthine dehydrogenase family protein molybdopterin-binding subunit n=1 Tax=Bradyrhizobium sp. Arg816 TaxID=2998491 RepID=UPI00249E3D8D|nr:molybdopterin cofactor-binding domain-containing protein [Bradyrhizobium sp. Arg816]MDI3566064.1 molybdopterin-dependent oxidoreductase [Bradyrhizobium sp. Arg816]
MLRASLIGGIAVYVAPLGSQAFASLFEQRLLTRPDWGATDGVLKYRIDGTSKVIGAKVFARDLRARDMPHWPQQQSHALVLRTTRADRIYAGFDLSLLGDDLKPDRVVTAADLTRDGLAFPDFYGEDTLLPEGKTPAYLGQAVAILVFHDFVRFRFAKEKLQFNDAVIRYGASTGPLQRDPWGTSRFVRVGGNTPYDDDVFSCLKDGPISPGYEKHEPVWPAPARDGELGARGMYHATAIGDELAQPPAEWVVLKRRYATQSGDTAALEPDNANGWYDSDKQELHLVVPTQSPQEVAKGAATMLQSSRIGLKRLFLYPCFTVGYGAKDSCSMPYYGLIAAVYGGSRPVRLANDRFEQFQAGLKRHQLSMDYTVAIERRTGLLQSLRAGIVANGGGRKNVSDLLIKVGATSLGSAYYFPKTDVTATAIASRAVDAGSARGYGALETMTATELMMDDIAGELGLDPIEFRLRNVLKTGMRNTQGAIPTGVLRAEAVLEKARAHALWSGRGARKQAFDADHPGKYYGVGFGCIQWRFGNGAEASLAKVELAPDGRIMVSNSGAEIGTGLSSGQAVACVRWLGRPADAVELAVTDWSDLPVETSGDPRAMSQADQDRLAENPRWSPAYASASSASNSSYYLSHTTREAARIVYVHGLLPAALAIWTRDAPAGSRVPSIEDARWRDGSLTVEGLEPLPLVRLVREAHARGLVVGAAVHGFNRWRWAEADFVVNNVAVHAPVDALSVRYGEGGDVSKPGALQGRYHVLDRQAVIFPPTQNYHAMVGYCTAAGTLAELVVDAASGKVTLLSHHTILDCGTMLVPDLVSGQIQGGTATGIGLALHEHMPLYEDGPGNGTWNFNRYHLPRGSDVAAWTQTAEILQPLSESEPPKGMAEATVIPIMSAIVNGIAHAIGHRFRTLPVTPDQILAVLG